MASPKTFYYYLFCFGGGIAIASCKEISFFLFRKRFDGFIFIPFSLQITRQYKGCRLFLQGLCWYYLHLRFASQKQKPELENSEG